jgi:hypothetical protein
VFHIWAIASKLAVARIAAKNTLKFAITAATADVKALENLTASTSFMTRAD